MMKQRVAILHTSFVFINVEPMVTNLFEELLPDAELVHFVDSGVLATVMREGEISEASTNRMVYMAQAAEEAGADVIFSACSSLGPTMGPAQNNVSVPIIRIDEGMAREASKRTERVGVLATVPTTLEPTANLVEQKAANLGKEIQTIRRLSEGAFEILMGGDKELHDQMVHDSALELAPHVEVIVLAQASMARLAPELAEATGVEVLSSPRSGVERACEVLGSVKT